MNAPITRYAYLIGCLYFFCMATAHFFGIKVPILFVYYDTPFYGYQDKIISFAVCAYIALFYAASKHRDVSFLAIIVMACTVLGLSSINSSAELNALLTSEQTALPYWLQTAAIACYLVVLIALYIKDGTGKNNSN